jgi:hypothetical protein
VLLPQTVYIDKKRENKIKGSDFKYIITIRIFLNKIHKNYINFGLYKTYVL